MKNISKFLLLAVTMILVSACSSEEPSKFINFPADEIAKGLDEIQNFSIILYDMDVTEDGKYMHQYKIIAQTNPAADVVADSSALADSTVSAQDLGFEEVITDWKEVSAEDFDFHSSDMGMEIISKKDGELTKVAAPPGYNQYVGNEKYGQWKTDPNSGDRFWAFYGRYMFISTMFRLMSPVPYGYYGSYYNSYRGVRPYYGPSSGGKYAYGTGSTHANNMNSKFSQRMNSNSALKTRVNNSVSKSSSRATGGQRTTATTQKRSRSGSRYNGSRSRARSWGGGGK
jgi:hypothetical protein